MKKLITVVVLLLAGCGGVTYPAQWDAAAMACLNHDGIKAVYTWSYEDPKSSFSVVCNDQYSAKVWNFFKK